MEIWLAFEKTVAGFIPTSMRIHAITLLMVLVMMLALIILHHMLKLHLMKKHGEEAFLCKKCREIFLPRHNKDDEPPKRCTRNHSSENFVPVYACTLPRKIKPLTEEED